MKLADDATSILHHHPAGIVDEYTPRGSTSSAYTTGQHDTHASGHQYEVRPSPQFHGCIVSQLNFIDDGAFFEYGACLFPLSKVVVAGNHRSPFSQHNIDDKVRVTRETGYLKLLVDLVCQPTAMSTNDLH